MHSHHLLSAVAKFEQSNKTWPHLIHSVQTQGEFLIIEKFLQRQVSARNLCPQTAKLTMDFRIQAQRPVNEWLQQESCQTRKWACDIH